jgi:hypothetical protein
MDYKKTLFENIFKSLEQQCAIIDEIINNKDGKVNEIVSFEHAKKLLTDNNIDLSNLYNIVIIIDNLKFYESVFSSDVKLTRKNVEFAIDCDNFKWYEIFQRTNVWDIDRAFYYAISNNKCNIVCECIKLNYTIYYLNIIAAIKHINDYDIIDKMIEIYIKNVGESCERENFNSILTAIIKETKSLKLLKNVFEKYKLNFTYEHIFKSIESNDLLMLEYILKNLKKNINDTNIINNIYLSMSENEKNIIKNLLKIYNIPILIF